VQIEATNDKEWADLVALAEGATALSLDQKDIAHRTLAAIAALRIAHENEWKLYCEERGMKWPKEVKSDFRPAVMWVLNQAKAKTGENHTAKASMMAGALDEYWEIERPKGTRANQIPEWLDEQGGYTGVYRKRLERLKEPKDKIVERYGRFLKLKPLEQREIPEWLEGFAGEVVIAAHIDRNTDKLEYRSVWRPDGGAFWHSKLDQFIAARPDYGEAVQPVRVQRAEPMFDLARRDADPRAPSDIQEEVAPPVVADVKVEEVGGTEFASQTEPQSRSVPVVAEMADHNDTNTSDAERSAAALGQQEEDAEVQTADARAEVGTEATMSGALVACIFPNGCRYLACKEQGRCLAEPKKDRAPQTG
jgi:hypothetical protein